MNEFGELLILVFKCCFSQSPDPASVGLTLYLFFFFFFGGVDLEKFDDW